MTPKDKAIQLVDHSLQMQPTNPDLSKCYQTAKVFAEYIALEARQSHEEYSEKYNYYLEVKKEILKL